MTRLPVLIMAGGTGGHVYPALAIADALLSRGQPVIWLGTQHGLESRIVVEQGIPIEWLHVSGLRRRGLVGWLVAPFKVGLAVLRALRIIRRVRPRLVLGMGGYVSGPGGVAARLSRTPLVIHEQNAAAGLTNRLLSRIATRSLQAFAGALPGAQLVGNPVRAAIRDIAPPEVRFEGREGALRLLVVGGSQGALALNRCVAQAVNLLIERGLDFDIRHQAGPATLEVAQDSYAKLQIRSEVTAYIEDMADALSWADLIVCRAGALTVSEVINVGLGAVFVPLPNAVDDHQTRNAQSLVAADAALCVQQADLDATTLMAAIADLGLSREQLLERARNARALRGADAVARVISECADVLSDPTLEVTA
ncbi:MAG: undecaprenyldiphospho-muramoylpentapeptide beta-N-acetylglucosaminyltransferase [Pseudomonadota bacterium]